MPFKMFNQGEVIQAKNLLNIEAPQTVELILFKNNRGTMGDTDTEAAYDEADFPGYAPITLTPASWTVTGGSPTTAEFAEQCYTATADVSPTQKIYGWLLRQATSGKAICAWQPEDEDGNPILYYPVSKSGDKIYAQPLMKWLTKAEAQE